MSDHVVILGCGRSGTSIFGELLQSIPGYTYYSEPRFDEVLGFDFSEPIAIKVPMESADYPAPPGLSFPIDTLMTATPTAPKLFWQVRHPLDAIASLRPGIANNWGHHPRPKDWQQWQSRPLIEQCAHHWNYINSVGFEAVKDQVEVCPFEAMIVDPMSFAINICRQIGVDHNTCITDLQRWADRVQDTNNEQFIEAVTSRNLSRPDHVKKVGRWRENLSPADIEAVLPIVQKTAMTFGYDVMADSES